MAKRRSYNSDYNTSISEVDYGILVIKKPRKNQFAVINLKLGTMQAGNEFSLNENDIECLSTYYRYMYPVTRQLNLLEVKQMRERNVRFISRDESLRRAEILARKLNNSSKFYGIYGKAGSYYSDGYSDIKFYHRMDKELRKRARKVGLFLIRYPNPVFNNILLKDCYMIFDLQSGTIVRGEQYTCHIEAVLEYIASLEAKKTKSKKSKSKSMVQA